MSSSPVHYIRTIQTSFTSTHPHSSHSKWAAARSAHHPHANLLLNNSQYHQHQAILQQQHQQQQLPPPSAQKYPPGLVTTPVVGRRRSSSIRRPASSTLSATPSSSPTSPTSPTSFPFKFDPFADDPTPSTPPQHSTTRSGASYKTSPTSNNSRPLTPTPAPKHYTIQIPAAPQRRTSPPASDRDAKAKLVAGILLNRIHAVGRPRRQFSYASEQPKVYVKSGLSSVVSVEA